MSSKLSKRKLDSLPTTTAHQARLRIYQATRRPRLIDEEMVTSWGRVRVKGKLGQGHADVVDAMFFRAMNARITSEGRLALLIDYHQVRDTSRQKSGSTFSAILDDLLSAIVEIREPLDLACSGHLIDHIGIAERLGGQKIVVANPLGGERFLRRVEIGLAMMKLLDADLHFTRDPTPIASLRHGISQAVARLLLTHRDQPNGGWKVDETIEAVAGRQSIDSMKNRRRELRDDIDTLSNAGVYLRGLPPRLYTTPGHAERAIAALRGVVGAEIEGDTVYQKPGAV